MMLTPDEVETIITALENNISNMRREFKFAVPEVRSHMTRQIDKCTQLLQKLETSQIGQS